MAEERMQVGLTLGASFAELCAIDSRGKTLFSQRSYLPKEPLKNLFMAFQKTCATKSINLNVNLRALQKIFGTRLGGSVAQIVTSGFETWPVLRQPLIHQDFTMTPHRTEPLASQELIFGLPERVSCRGETIKNLDRESLEFISAKLKLMNVERVCLNLLFQHLNETNFRIAHDFFTAEGFQVFSQTRPETSRDEVTAWRTNILNACLAGTFQEIDEELREVLRGLEYDFRIQYLRSDKTLTTEPLNCLAETVMGWSSLLPETRDVLFLGMEKWSYIRAQKLDRWKSPWGSVEVSHRDQQDLSIQPTSLLEKDFYNQVSWTHEATFEPGPMSFGRSQKPLWIDLQFHMHAETRQAFENLTQPSGLNRFREAMMIFERNLGSEKIEAEAFEESLHLMTLPVDQTEISIAGFWAESLLPHLRRKFPKIQFQLLQQSSNYEAYHVAQLS